MPSLQERVDAYIDRKHTTGEKVPLDIIARSLANQNRFGRRLFLAWFEEKYPLLRELLWRQHPDLWFEVPLEVTYTTATPNYDGFGTETVEFDAGTLNKKMLRKVETPLDAVEWQRMRYGSGLHVALNEAQYTEAHKYPWFVPPAQKSP